MQSKSDKKIIVLITIVAVGILFILGSFMRFNQQFYQNELSKQQDVLKEVSSQGNQEVKNKISESISFLETTAGAFTDMKSIHDKGVVSVLSYLTDISTFDLLGVSDTKGNSINNLGQIRDISNRKYFKQAMSNEIAVSEVLFSLVDVEQEVMIIAVPLLNQYKQVSGVVFGLYNIETISKLLNKDTANESYVLITDSNGNYITRAEKKDALMESNNLWTDMSRYYLYDRNVDEIKDDISKSKEGVFNFRYKNEERFTYYAPMGVNNWYIFSTTNLLYLEQNVTSLTDSVFHLSLIIVGVAVLCFISLLWYSRQVTKEIRLTRDESLYNEQMMRLAISHTNLVIFEYDHKEKRIHVKNDVKNTKPIFDDLGSLLNSTDEMSHVDKKFERKFLQLFERIEHEPTSEDTIKMHFDHQIYWYHIILQNIYDDKKRNILNTIGCVEDVTEIEEHKKQLIEKQQFEDAMNVNALMMVKADLDNDRLIELNKAPIDQAYSKFVEHFIDDYVEETFKTKIANQISADQLIYELHCGNEILEFEFEMIVDQSKLWVSCKIYLMCDKNNEVHAILTFNDINEQKQKELEIKHRAEYDGLTSLFNAFTFKSHVNEYLRNTDLKETRGIFILLDLDNFKAINDTFGHQYGDQALKDVAKVLKHRFRSDDIIGRLGGDEFAVFLKNVNNLAVLDRICKDVIHDLHHAYEKDGVQITVSASIGVSITPNHGDTFEDLYGKSDLALYDVKRSSKNNYKIYRASSYNSTK